MKVKDLIKEINKYQELYPDFLEWSIYTEQLDQEDKESKRGSGWEYFREGGYDDWEYFRCCGFHTLFPKERIFTINVNY